MLSPLPRCGGWGTASLIHPVVSAFPGMAARSARTSSFSRLARRSHHITACTLAPSPYFVTRFTEGFNRFVASTVAPVASGRSGCRVGLAPTGKAPPFSRRTPKADLYSEESASDSRRSRTLNFSGDPPNDRAPANVRHKEQLQSRSLARVPDRPELAAKSVPKRVPSRQRGA